MRLAIEDRGDVVPDVGPDPDVASDMQPLFPHGKPRKLSIDAHQLEDTINVIVLASNDVAEPSPGEAHVIGPYGHGQRGVGKTARRRANLDVAVALEVVGPFRPIETVSGQRRVVDFPMVPVPAPVPGTAVKGVPRNQPARWDCGRIAIATDSGRN